MIGADQVGSGGPGAAYVFTESASGWIQTAKLTASDGVANDGFGFPVLISGNTVVVGAGVRHDRRRGRGLRVHGARLRLGEHDPDGRAHRVRRYGGDEFGSNLSISGNTVVVGAAQATVVAGWAGPGAAYVFTEPASGWTDMTQTAKLTASDGKAGDRFGSPILISGNTVIVGAAGGAYVFTEPASGWANMTQTAKLTGSDINSFDSVSMSGNTLVLGSEAGLFQGWAYVFTEPASGWANMTETAKLTASDGAEGDGFGGSVSISGNMVVVGAWNATVDGNASQGAAYVFTEPASGWANMTQTAKLTASDGAAGDLFGTSVSISGNTVVVGAWGATVDGNAGQGAAYVFATPPTPLTVSPTDWTSAGLTLTLGNDGSLHVYTTGKTTDAVPPVAPASVSNIEITSPSSTTANLSVDSTNGDPIPNGDLSYSGGGSLIITGSGSVTLSGTNIYTGGTTVSSGTLLVNAASALPGGTSLTVGAGGTFIFDPSSTGASNVTSTTTAAPVTTNVVSSSPVSSATAVASVVKPSSLWHDSPPSIVPPAALRLPQPIPAVGLGTPAKRIVGDLAWLAQAANGSDNSDQQRKKDVAILALESVFAQYDQ